MPEHCCNNNPDCPVCGQTDRSEPKMQTITNRITHCNDCRYAIYGLFTFSEQYDCNHPAFDDPTRVLYASLEDDKSVEDMPLPDICPRRTTIVIETI